jgi:hypothetical protein
MRVMGLPPAAVPCPYTAYLRVYEPLESFPEPDRARWASYASTAGGRDAGLVAEHRTARRNLLAVPPVAVPAQESEDAFVVQLEGATYVAPVRTRLRSWLAFTDFRDGVAGEVLDAFFPPAVAAATEAEHELWRREDADARSPILTATWAVPLQWFVPFAPRDQVGEGLLFRTRMGSARRRVARGLRVLGEAFEDAPYADDLTDVGRWLEEFHPRSVLELDYDVLAALGGGLLVEDRSVAEVATALAALSAGDEETAATAYDQLVTRWSDVRTLEHAN